MWNDGYSHGVLYYLAAGWMIAMALGMIVLTVRSTVSRRLFKTVWLPLAVTTAAALYEAVYLAHPHGNYMLDLPDLISLSSILGWESLVAARIIVSNNDYPAIFASSSLHAGLADGDSQVEQVSAQGVKPLPEQLKAAADGETLMPDGDTLLKARAVHGGWFYWTEDITELKRLREKLDDTADYLEEENAMLRVSARIEEGRRKTEEQTKLYDRVTQSLRPQLDRLDALLRALPQEGNGFRETMKTTGILVAYVKRRSNLLLLADTHPTFTGEELALCFEESAKAMRMADIPCELSADRTLRIASQTADALYEAFETALENALPSLRSVSISLQSHGERPTLELTMETEDQRTLRFAF